MRDRLRGLSERDWRTLDRVFVAGLVVIADDRPGHDSELEGPLVLNLVVMTGIALSFLWRRSRPMVTAPSTLVGLVVMAVFLTQPPNLVSAVLMLIATGYAVGRHMGGRPSAGIVAVGDGGDRDAVDPLRPERHPVPGHVLLDRSVACGRTIRNQTRLARELSEKAERAQHAHEEDERRP